MAEPEEIAAENSVAAAESAADAPQKQPEPPVRPASRPSRFERYVRRVISGSILADKQVQKHYPYVLFMAVLMFLYIANGFHTQKLHRQHERLTARVKELRAQSLTISSQRMIATRQSEIIRELEERGIPLEELVSPPKIIDK